MSHTPSEPDPTVVTDASTGRYATGGGVEGTYTDTTYVDSTYTGGYSDAGAGQSDTKDAAKEQAGAVKDTATDAGKQVVGTAKDQAQNVASEAATQGKQLVQQAGDQLSSQASSAQQSLAGTVRTYAKDLASMSSSSETPGAVSGLVQQAADRGHSIADFLENREPRDVLTEVQRFARRRPAAFLGIAAAAGFLAGRLTRNLAAEHRDNQTPDFDASTAGPRYASAPTVETYGQEAVPARPSASLEELPDESATGRDALYDPMSETPLTSDSVPSPYQAGGGVTGGPR